METNSISPGWQFGIRTAIGFSTSIPDNGPDRIRFDSYAVIEAIASMSHVIF